MISLLSVGAMNWKTNINPYFLITIDVEDWFQVENFKRWIPFSSWSSYELRVEKNTHRLLDLFDSIELNQKTEIRYQNPEIKKHPNYELWKIRQRPETTVHEKGDKPEKNQTSSLPHGIRSLFHRGQTKNNKIKATFFILGWLAERLPNLVREIHARGHEVASHGYNHHRCSRQSPEELRRDLNDSKKLLEDILGKPVWGYRAPSFSISDNILKIIEECGYLYDSSFNSFAMHGRYGKVDLSLNFIKGIAIEVSKNFFELPISNFKMGRSIIPWGGGGYFRLIPFPIFKLGIKTILKNENAYLLFLHPWEIDPEQPMVDEASTFHRFRHYVNLNKTHPKLSKLLETFKRCRFITCGQYINEIAG